MFWEEDGLQHKFAMEKGSEFKLGPQDQSPCRRNKEEENRSDARERELPQGVFFISSSRK